MCRAQQRLLRQAGKCSDWDPCPPLALLHEVARARDELAEAEREAKRAKRGREAAGGPR